MVQATEPVAWTCSIVTTKNKWLLFEATQKNKWLHFEVTF